MNDQERKNPKNEPVNVAAIIPARAGKQSIPYKNLQKLGGKSLLEWAVNLAFEAKNIDVVVVSTEDERTKKEALKLGALVAPRPAEYSQPTSGDAGFYSHAAEWMESEHGWKPDLLINLRPTGPLRFKEDLEAMVDYMLKNSDADGIKSVIEAPIHPYKMWQFGKENAEVKPGFVAKLNPIFDNKYRQEKGPDQPRQKIQELFPVYWQDAQIDITRRKFVFREETLKNDNVWGTNIHGYVLDPRSVVDIDTPEDMRRAEEVYAELSKGKKE